MLDLCHIIKRYVCKRVGREHGHDDRENVKSAESVTRHARQLVVVVDVLQRRDWKALQCQQLRPVHQTTMLPHPHD